VYSVTVLCLAIDLRILRHQRVDVGDPDEDPDRATGQRLGDLDLIEIA
jgi:hypothetical protein